MRTGPASTQRCKRLTAVLRRRLAPTVSPKTATALCSGMRRQITVGKEALAARNRLPCQPKPANRGDGRVLR